MTYINVMPGICKMTVILAVYTDSPHFKQCYYASFELIIAKLKLHRYCFIYRNTGTYLEIFPPKLDIFRNILFHTKYLK